ncbi:hypothetical protein BOX15_Mlig000301g2 [Macrostomum lignano]|uniref:Uncharacterized protein n=1 Tax=Macrostomum lignano TaxID=282301 RepID=A0A267ELS8_9PLAT|nr:hypothetical protein BOX15_Mlig000301g2 [Macrostomum lignano]
MLTISSRLRSAALATIVRSQPLRLLSTAAPAVDNILTLEERQTSDTEQSSSSYTLTMSSPPANTFTEAFLLQFIDAMHQLRERRHVRSLVIKSSLPTIFSSGFDLNTLCRPASRNQLKDFLKLFREAFYSLYTAPFYTVAQIAGHAPAGGCALALACDYRIALDSDKIKIGLTPTKVGITPPEWLIRLAESRFSSPHACERAVLPAQLHTPRQALALGLVDILAKDSDALDQAAGRQLSRVHATDPRAINSVRSLLSRPVLGAMSDETDLDQFVDSVLRPECQQLLAGALQRMA